jgi:hypothetical protein
MSIWKVHKDAARVQEPGLEEYETALRREVAAAMSAGDTDKPAGQCVWPACGHGQARGDYCIYHYHLLVGAGCIDDKDHASRWDEIMKSARAKAAAKYPNNPEYQKWDDEDDD